MANNWFQQLISPYSRQLTRQDVNRPMWITIGVNVPATWETEVKPWFVAEYEVPILPASGAIAGNRGQIITYGLPRSLDPMWEVHLHDYDAALRDQLLIFSASRTELRIWAWGIFVAVGCIARIGLQMPMDTTLTLTFALKGLRYIKGSAYNKDVVDFDTSTPVHLLDMPFALSAGAITTYNTYTILYGTEILP
jgi:hypothetical protein